MSKIVLVSGEPELPAAVLMRLRPLCEAPVSELRTTIAEGLPFLSRVLYGNDHLVVAATLLEAVGVFESEGLELKVYDLAEDAAPSERPEEISRIDISVLRNLLDAADGYR